MSKEILASKTGNMKVMKSLITDMDDNTKTLCLVMAVESSQLNMVKFLLKNGASPEGHGEIAPLKLAMEASDVKVAKVLIDAGADHKFVDKFKTKDAMDMKDHARILTLIDSRINKVVKDANRAEAKETRELAKAEKAAAKADRADIPVVPSPTT